jgi:probable rRNA maturation factor
MANLLIVNSRHWQIDFGWLGALEIILKKQFKIKQEISISLLTPLEIKKLNKVYRHKNKVTDVLSFTLADKVLLGEVLICIEQAKKQAKIKGHSLKRELQILTIHGILHLLGYDHERSEAEWKKQTKMEEEILKKMTI